ncbi:type II toxin-antitoxin system MqsA family antitoxin [Clostridium bowmanii]|nr:type II toxin-antitoxin system MqsA family antitoxin [Clostridium bowmanii]
MKNTPLNFDGHTIIIKGVPANICKQCGGYYVENNIALKLEIIIEDAKKNKSETLVINYS